VKNNSLGKLSCLIPELNLMIILLGKGLQRSVFQALGAETSLAMSSKEQGQN
jgi:hypothetical protein